MPTPSPAEISLIADRSSRMSSHLKKNCTGKNACATLEPFLMTFYRRNLPHWHPEGNSIFITWRLFGSLPATVLRKIHTVRNGCATDSAEIDSEESAGRIFRQLDTALDSAKSGPLWLADPELAGYAEYPICRGAVLGRYDLHAYVVMPNHVHVLLDPRLPLAKISSVIKGVSARDANATLGRTGKPFWQDESFDHWIRNGAEFERIRHYIEWNPVRAGLVARPQDWKWSSAGSAFFKRLPS
jgi:REP-associated tyrosine transposase